MLKPRVVVTGYGAISPIGNSAMDTWSSLLRGDSGIAEITLFDAAAFSTRFAGEVKGFDPTDYIAKKDCKKMDRFIQLGVAAGLQALEHAKMNLSQLDVTRIGVSIGSGIGGLQLIEENHSKLVTHGPRKVSPFFVPSTITNMISGFLSIMTGLQGPNLNTVTACTTGLHNIGLAARLIQCGDADAMLCGGAEAAITELGIAGFGAAKALSTRNEQPQLASRPWDKDRDGFVMGEGAGVLMLESLAHAEARGATIYGELVGFGMSGDAFHMTSPPESGEGAARAMQNALRDAQVSAEQVGYINAHGTSTPAGDEAEIQAIKSVFGQAAYKVKVSSTKSMIGHLLGAAGSIEGLFTLLALLEQKAPPTINLDEPSPACDLDLVPHVAASLDTDFAMCNSFGFGGTNGSLLFKRFTQ